MDVVSAENPKGVLGSGGRVMERMTKRDTDGQAMMDCEKCKADWTGKRGKPMVDCTALYCRNRLKDRLAAYEDTGLTPESVETLKLSMMGKTIAEIKEFNGLPVDRLREVAEADKDGCVVVRPCKGLSTKPDDGRQLVLEQAIAHLESLLRDHDFECEDCKRDHRELLELLVELKERRG